MTLNDPAKKAGNGLRGVLNLKKFAEIRVICDSFLYIPKLFA